MRPKNVTFTPDKPFPSQSQTYTFRKFTGVPGPLNVKVCVNVSVVDAYVSVVELPVVIVDTTVVVLSDVEVCVTEVK
jgi:hypothetical protein